jgi:mannose/cellobiose epimerase-like protein (N-acyl-D-glucosamine 2-epimerase family)
MRVRATWIGAALLALVGCTDDLYPLELEDYTPVSEFLTDPLAAADFAVDCADFWTAARDDEFGGYYSFVDAAGGVAGQTDKSVVGQSRDAYGFARAFMLTGDEAYLDHAEHALDFLVEYGWDDAHGGWFFTTDQAGEPVALFGNEWDPNFFKWSFAQHYALVGLAAVCEATRDELWCGWLEDGRDILDAQMWDSGALGYFDSADLDWSNPTGKGFTPTVDAFTTHGLPMALGDDATVYAPRALDLADLMDEHFVGGLDSAQIGFVEYHDSGWDPLPSSVVVQPGHGLKTAWSLARAHRLDPAAGYLDGAVALVRDTLDHGGYDTTHGGPFYECSSVTGQCPDQEKVYWVLEQGVVAGLSIVPLVDDDSQKADLLRMADESADFYARHLVDAQYGETVSETSRNGLTVTVPDKGNAFKAGYHSVELGYLTYLYSSLHLHDEPVTLYYRFDATGEDRDLRVQPLAAQLGELVITEVSLDGAPFPDFHATEFTLSVPADVGGVFQVTYQAG